jgi:hypothetical protein
MVVAGGKVFSECELGIRPQRDQPCAAAGSGTHVYNSGTYVPLATIWPALEILIQAI